MMRQLMTTAILLALGPATGGCMFLIPQHSRPDPVIVTKPLAAAPDVAATPAAGIRVITRRELPPGLFYTRRGRDQQLFALPGFPSADSHHVVIAGVVSERTGRTRPDPKKELLAMQAQAAELGGNTLFLPQPGGVVGYAVWVAPAATINHKSHRVGLREAGRKLVAKKFRKSGKVAMHAMTQAQPIAIKLIPGTCYAVAFALGQDAVLVADASLRMSSNDGLMLNRSAPMVEEFTSPQGFKFRAPYDGPLVHKRSVAFNLGCAQGRGTARVTATASRRSQTLGTEGSYFTQLYTRKISRAELAKRQRDMAQAVARAQESQRRYAAAERQRQQQRARQQQERDARRSRMARSSSSRSSSSGGGARSTHFSFNLKNECRQTVKMYINGGGNPKYSSGTGTSMSSNSIRSFSGSGSKTYWIVDSSGNGMSSFSAGPGQRDMRILPSCTGFAPR